MDQIPKADRYGSLIVDLITNALIITAIFMKSQSSLVRFIAIFIPIIYYPCLYTLFSRSIGDKVFSLKVIDQHGNKIGFRAAIKRFFCLLKYSAFVLLLTNILFIIYFSRTEESIRRGSYDFEEESKTYLIKENRYPH